MVIRRVPDGLIRRRDFTGRWVKEDCEFSFQLFRDC